MSDEKGDNEEKALEVKKLDKPIAIGDKGIVLNTANDVWGIAKGIHNARMAPRSLDSVDKIAVAILTGAEAGLSPMMSIRSVYVINGAPAWLSKAARALVLNSGLLKPGTSIQEGVAHAQGCQDGLIAGRGCVDACYGFCKTHRNGDVLPKEYKFSVGDAKTAKLWDDPKKEPWKKYHKRMLVHRAAGFHFDDCWSEVLMGMTTVEVLQDHPQAAFVREGDTVTAHATPPGVDPLIAPARSPDQIIDVQDEGAGASATSGVDSPPEPAPSSEPTPGPFPTDKELEEAGFTDTEIDKLTQDEPPITATEVLERQGKMPAEPLPPRYVGDEEEPEQIDEATRKKEAAARSMPTTEESLDRVERETIAWGKGPGDPMDEGIPQSVLDAEALELSHRQSAGTNGEKKAAEKEEIVCQRPGCGVIINPQTETRWKTKTGWRCAECGPEPK